MRTILAYPYFLFFMLFSNFKMIKINKLKKQERFEEAEEYIHIKVMEWGRKFLKVSGIKVNVEGRENIPEEACCFVSNHQGYFDIPATIGYIDKPFGVIAKKEIEKHNIISKWMKQIKCIFINREDIRDSLRAINEGAQNIKNGHSMLIFPEGTRSKGPKMNEFKKGSLKMALKAKAPIVPVTIDGSYKYLEGNKYRMKKGQINIIIGKPVYIDKLSREEVKGISSELKNMIEKNIKTPD
ncbi:lysophospholipid acyltransferase family protein [Clostridium sp. DL1XJH146]